MSMESAVSGRASAVAWLMDNGPWLLLAATLALFATETLFNAPFWMLAVAGLYQAGRRPRALLDQPLLRHAGLLFLCLWLPQLAALPDAVNPVRSTGIALAYLHYYFAAVFVLGTLRDRPATLGRLETALFAITTFWVLDALLQYAAGTDLFGYPYRPGQLTGMFDPKIRLGHLLAVLLPAYCEFVRRSARERPWLWLLPLLLLVVVFLSGKRVAWLMAAVAIGGYMAYLLHARLLSWRSLLLVAVITCAAGAGLLATNQSLARRAGALLGIFSGEAAQVDRATSHRLPLWTTAMNMARANWINGVGTRGYRYAFREYAGKDNFFLKRGRQGQTHPHQLLLEVAAETGVIGIAGLLAFWWLLLARAWCSLRTTPARAPWIISGFVAWLPFNAHLAFYGSYWSSVSWWVLLGLLMATATTASDPAQPCRAS